MSADVDEILRNIARAAKLLMEGVAVLVVVYGALEAFVSLLALVAKPSVALGARRAIWRRFGTWLLLGLEFELAVDIIGSVVTPTWAEIGELAAIAVIRTFLNYFLQQDLDRAPQEEGASRQVSSRKEAA
jgi:uncharacterized membrane protein